MASGVPCIVQEIPVMHEVTAGHALLLDYNDRKAATAAMLKALLDTGFREAIIAAGLKRAAEFSYRRLAIERIEGMRAMLGLPATELAGKHPPVYASSFS